MSERKCWITGNLTPERLKRARLATDAQLAKYPSGDRGDSAPYGGMSREARMFEQNAAREFLAQALGVEHIPSDYKSRWSARAAKNARLLVAPKEIQAKHERRWVLVTGRAPKFTIVGWCWAWEVQERGVWHPEAPRPAWFVEWKKLRNAPMSAELVSDAR